MDATAIIAHYLQSNWVVSFTTLKDHEMWSANAFYFFNKIHFSLIILTSKETHHGKMLLGHENVSGTICLPNKDIAQLKGIQFQGKMQMLVGDIAEASYKKYCQAFPIAQKKRETVWELQLSTIKYTDNSLGFGTKLYWNRDHEKVYL